MSVFFCAETAESYEFLRRRTTTSRLMRGGRDYSLPNYLDQNDNEKDGVHSRITANETPFPIEDILASLHKDLTGDTTDSSPIHFQKSSESSTKMSGYKRTRAPPRYFKIFFTSPWKYYFLIFSSYPPILTINTATHL